MFKILMIIGVVAVAIGWIGYGIWRWREIQQEKKHPGAAKTDHLKKVDKSFDDYIKKVQSFKKPDKPEA